MSTKTTLRPSLQFLLTSPLMCNVPWRSRSRFFTVDYWHRYTTKTTTFEQAIQAYLYNLPVTYGHLQMFSKLATSIDELECAIDSHPHLITELTSAATGFLPHASAEDILVNFSSAILCDLLLWSLEADWEQLPIQTPFDANDGSENTLFGIASGIRQIANNYVLACRTSSMSRISTAQGISFTSAFSVLAEITRSTAECDVATSNIFHWCSCFMFHLMVRPFFFFCLPANHTCTIFSALINPSSRTYILLPSE